MLIKLKTIKKIINPGKKLNHQAISITSFPSLRIVPQLICGGVIPIPKKLKPLSAKIAPPTANVKLMKNMGAKRGIKYLKMIFIFETLAIFRIFINGLFAIAKLSLLINLAVPIQPVIEITIIKTRAEAFM